MTEKNCHPSLSQQPPSKSWSPAKLPLFENLVGGSTPPSRNRGGGGAHYVSAKSIFFETFCVLKNNGLTFKPFFFEQDVFFILNDWSSFDTKKYKKYIKSMNFVSFCLVLMLLRGSVNIHVTTQNIILMFLVGF